MFSWYILSLVGMSISLAVQIPARKNSEIFLVWTHRRVVLQIFIAPEPVLSRQSVQILAKMCNFSPKYATFSPRREKCHYNSSSGFVGGKKSTLFLAGMSRREKKLFFDPINSRHALNRPYLFCQMVSRGKNAGALYIRLK